MCVVCRLCVAVCVLIYVCLLLFVAYSLLVIVLLGRSLLHGVVAVCCVLVDVCWLLLFDVYCFFYVCLMPVD